MTSAQWSPPPRPRISRSLGSAASRVASSLPCVRDTVIRGTSRLGVAKRASEGEDPDQDEGNTPHDREEVCVATDPAQKWPGALIDLHAFIGEVEGGELIRWSAPDAMPLR
jgi:hypothetical protein